MRALLLGANGQVGNALRERPVPGIELIPATREGRLVDGSRTQRLDLRDFAAIKALVQRVRPEVVINAAAYTAVDRAEDDVGSAHAINALAPAALADACRAVDALLLHYSTDYVFDGTAGRAYRPDDRAAPLGVYGRSKHAGEQAIVASGARYLILRTAWLYGLQGHNFLRTMLRLAQERDELRVVADQVGSPTPAWLIADATFQVLERRGDCTGVHHLVAAGQTSWHGFAQAIFENALACGWIDRVPRVVPVPTAEYPTRARRPAYSVLDTSSLRAAFGVELPDWQDALSRTIARHRHFD